MPGASSSCVRKAAALQDLNAEQMEAVRAEASRLAVIAGPGTGKTRTLTHRVAYLIEERKIPARGILAITFTRGAASEMRERLKQLLIPSDANLSDLWVETFHAAALRILREEGYPFGPGVAFSVVAEEEKPGLCEGLVQRREAPALLEEIRRCKQALKPPESGPAAEFQRKLLASRRLDFDDLLLYACRLFDEKPEALSRWRGRFRHILADEFQDTSFAQYEFLRRLACASLFVIGDPDQAIYGFAGDGFEPFDRFKRDFPDCRILSLSENYRSKASIVDAAKQVISKNRAPLPRDLRAKLERGLPVEIAPHQTEGQEAEMIAKKIEGLLGGASYFTIDTRWAEKEGESYAYGLQDIAILYRFHVQARRIEQALGRAGLPCRTYGKTLKQDGKEISAAEDLEDFQEGKDAAPPAFGPRGEWISLMTLHRAKGLEFPAVFLAGCEEGVLPCLRSDGPGKDAAVEEERRLFYVGMTRAKSRLFLSYAKKRILFGRTLEAGPSPFLKDIEEELRILRESRPPKKKPAKPDQLSLF